MEIFDKINDLLKSKGITMTSLCEDTGIARTSMHNYLTGKTKIDVNNLQKICTVAEISIPQLFDENYNNEELTEIRNKVTHLESELFFSNRIIEILKSKQIHAYYLESMKVFISKTYQISFDENGEIDMEFLSNEEDLKDKYNTLPKEELEKEIESQNKGIAAYNEAKSKKINEDFFYEITCALEYYVENERAYNENIIEKIKKIITYEPSENTPPEDVNFWVESTKLYGNKLAKKTLAQLQPKIDEYNNKTGKKNLPDFLSRLQTKKL